MWFSILYIYICFKEIDLYDFMKLFLDRDPRMRIISPLFQMTSCNKTCCDLLLAPIKRGLGLYRKPISAIVQKIKRLHLTFSSFINTLVSFLHLYCNIWLPTLSHCLSQFCLEPFGWSVNMAEWPIRPISPSRQDLRIGFLAKFLQPRAKSLPTGIKEN